MKHLYSQAKFSTNDIAQFRLNVLTFYENHGLAATQEAFRVSRSTIFSWKKKLTDADGRLTALLPGSTRPHAVRRMIVDHRILVFIKGWRELFGRIGKEKVKVLLDAFCHKEHLPTISVSKVGRIIKRNNWFFHRSGSIYHNPNHHWGEKRRKKARVPARYQSTKAGELLQLDSLVRFDLNIKRYIVTAIDLYSKFSFAFSYKSLSSTVALNFYQKLTMVAPFRIRAVKTDNGLEFLGVFDAYLKKQGVPHYFSYPRTPQSNAFVERFNRTIQEEFVEANRGDLEEPVVFNAKLMEYLLYYNTVRPHQALQYLTPMGFMVKEAAESRMYWTSTIDEEVTILFRH